ncbi:hypothetical protein [Flaviaesturariibacter terrae]
MRMIIRYVPAVLLGLLACREPEQRPEAGTVISNTNLKGALADSAAAARMRAAADTICGDFNGDGQPEKAWLEPPVGLSLDSLTCADSSCTAQIRFSNRAIPPIAVRMCIGGIPDNLGNLYGDGRDVIGLNPDWFTSCWHGYYTWTFRGGSWKAALDTFSTHCNQWDDGGMPPVRAVPGKPGWAEIRYSESTEDSIVLRTAERPLRQYP